MGTEARFNPAIVSRLFIPQLTDLGRRAELYLAGRSEDGCLVLPSRHPLVGEEDRTRKLLNALVEGQLCSSIRDFDQAGVVVNDLGYPRVPLIQRIFTVTVDRDPRCGGQWYPLIDLTDPEGDFVDLVAPDHWPPIFEALRFWLTPPKQRREFSRKSVGLPTADEIAAWDADAPKRGQAAVLDFNSGPDDKEDRYHPERYYPRNIRQVLEYRNLRAA